jgi:hypothetical protein
LPTTASKTLSHKIPFFTRHMRTHPKPFLFPGAVGAGLALLLCSGCITVPAKVYTNAVAYEPVRSPVQIDASAAVEGVDALAPEMRAVWKHWMNSDTNIVNYLDGAGQALRNDLATSGLFARIVTNDPARADYLVKASCLEGHPSDFRVTVTLTATEVATGKQISSHTVEHSFGTSMFDMKLKEVLPEIMARLKAELVADLQAKARQQQELAAQKEAELLTQASLRDLLAGSDQNASVARARNRALVAARIQQLPAILRDSKTEQLSALVVKIEQTILDLDHECEIAKDKAQQSVASGGAPDAMQRSGGRGEVGPAASSANLDELRDLAICYRERIGLLKPIAAALKEEIANRNR